MAQTLTLKSVNEELKKIKQKMATKEDIDSLKETIEILSNPDTMRQIADSVGDIQHNRVKEVHSVQDMLKEM